jgi:hypothetical protein
MLAPRFAARFHTASVVTSHRMEAAWGQLQPVGIAA